MVTNKSTHFRGSHTDWCTENLPPHHCRNRLAQLFTKHTGTRTPAPPPGSPLQCHPGPDQGTPPPQPPGRIDRPSGVTRGSPPPLLPDAPPILILWIFRSTHRHRPAPEQHSLTRGGSHNTENPLRVLRTSSHPAGRLTLSPSPSPAALVTTGSAPLVTCYYDVTSRAPIGGPAG